MKKISVWYFGPLRESLGMEQEEWTFAEEPSVALILARMAERYPGVAGLLESCRVAVNMAYAGSDMIVPTGADVAIIPPVAGG